MTTPKSSRSAAQHTPQASNKIGKISKSPIIRALFFMLGCSFVAIGVVGIVLPVLPTTPFLLLAAACFARSSARFHRWLMAHPVFGKMLLAWQTRRAIPRYAKWLAWTMMTISCALLFYRLSSDKWWIAALVSAICAATIIWMARLPDE